MVESTLVDGHDGTVLESSFESGNEPNIRSFECCFVGRDTSCLRSFEGVRETFSKDDVNELFGNGHTNAGNDVFGE